MEVNETNVDDDRHLLQLMMAGEESAFVALYRKYQALVYRFSLHTGGLRHIAEEATQETFLALMRAPQQYRSERGPLLLYLLGIARRLVWKSAKRDRLYAPLDEGQELTGLLPDPVNDLARIQQVQRVRHAVLSLPPKYREVIVLCSLQELSYEQAAAVVGCSIGTVRSRMHRAKELLLRKLQGGVSTEVRVRERSLLKLGQGIDYDV